MLPRIMILDDEEDIRTSLACFLEDFDEFHVRAVDSAESALEELRREPAELCIVDIRLPAMNGAEFIRIAKEQNLCPRHILHTGSTDFRQYVDITRLHMREDDVFQKPCDSMSMLERIRHLLRED